MRGSMKLPLVRADRVILRQILLSLINHALNTRSEGATAIGATGDGDGVTLWVQFQGDGQMSSPVEDRDSALEAARYWAGRTGAAFQQTLPAGEQAGICRVALSLPLLSQPVVMVVDDQEPAIRMFGRYLSRSNTRVVGLHEPERVLPIARRLQPHAIILDVMMPTIDGWETLQALKADPETHHIPVIICSVWDEPELAHSLGATEFLKKPITQKDLLSALLRLKVLDSLDGSSPADT
jgi:CheY-like chemotaxis protein